MYDNLAYYYIIIIILLLYYYFTTYYYNLNLSFVCLGLDIGFGTCPLLQVSAEKVSHKPILFMGDSDVFMNQLCVCYERIHAPSIILAETSNWNPGISWCFFAAIYLLQNVKNSKIFHFKTFFSWFVLQRNYFGGKKTVYIRFLRSNITTSEFLGLDMVLSMEHEKLLKKWISQKKTLKKCFKGNFLQQAIETWQDERNWKLSGKSIYCITY